MMTIDCGGSVLSSVQRFELVLLLLTAVIGFELIARRLRMPPAAAYILGGIALALIPSTPDIELDPDLALVLFLPPLLLSGAYFTVWRDFRANLRIILGLAIGAVVFTTAAVGIVVHWMVPALPWAACFALGAIVSPPDAVAAKAVLQRIALPPRVTVLLEGESLVNDATRPGAVSVRCRSRAHRNVQRERRSHQLCDAGNRRRRRWIRIRVARHLVLQRMRDPILAVISSSSSPGCHTSWASTCRCPAC